MQLGGVARGEDGPRAGGANRSEAPLLVARSIEREMTEGKSARTAASDRKLGTSFLDTAAESHAA